MPVRHLWQVHHNSKLVNNGYGGYQASHKQLTEEFSRRAFVAYTVHNGEVVNVKAILAHFPHGSTKAVMIGVCLVQYLDLLSYF